MVVLMLGITLFIAVGPKGLTQDNSSRARLGAINQWLQCWENCHETRWKTCIEQADDKALGPEGAIIYGLCQKLFNDCVQSTCGPDPRSGGR